MEWKYRGNAIEVNEQVIFQCIGDEYDIESWQYANVIEQTRMALFDKENMEDQSIYIRHFYDIMMDHIHSPNYTDSSFVTFLKNIPNEKIYFFLDIFTQVIEAHDHKQQYFSDYLELMKVKVALLLDELSSMVEDGFIPSEETMHGEQFSKLLVSSLYDWIQLIQSPDHRFYFNRRSLKPVQQEMYEILNGNQQSSLPFKHRGIRVNLDRLKKIYNDRLSKQKKDGEKGQNKIILPNYYFSLEVLEEQIIHDYFSKYYFMKEAITTLPNWYRVFVNSFLIVLMLLFIGSIFCNKVLFVMVPITALFLLLYIVMGFIYFKRMYVFYLYFRMFGILIVGFIPIIISPDIWKFLIVYQNESIMMSLIGIIGVYLYLCLEVNNRHRKVINHYSIMSVFKNTFILICILLLQAHTISYVFNYFLFEFFVNHIVFDDALTISTLTMMGTNIAPTIIMLHALFAIVIGVMLQGFWDSKSFVEPV